MNRRGSKQEIIDLFKRIKNIMPDSVIRTTLIVGFPGESKADFEELISFIDEMKIDKLGVFEYSQEENTIAGNMENQVSPKTKKSRLDKIMNLQKEISYMINKALVGKTFDVIIEEVLDDKENYLGRSFRDSPDIDGNISVEGKHGLKVGDIVQAKVYDCSEYDLVSKII
jgi:ribosomal protein S12 methylthiotransferase